MVRIRSAVIRVSVLALWVAGGPFFRLSAREFGDADNTVGAANSFGNLLISGHLGTIKLSAREEFPLRYQFTSYRQVDSPLLGKGFIVPLMESTIVDHDWLLERTTLGGATHFLYRSAHDPNHFDSLDLSESADRRGAGSALVVKTKDGFELEYRDNRLASFRSPAGTRVSLRYDGDACVSIDAGAMGSVVSYMRRGGEAAEVRTHAGTYALRMQPYPAAEKEQGDSRMTLAEIGWPDGRKTTFAFSTKQKPARACLDITFAGETATYAWDPENDEALEACGVTYSVSPLLREYDPSEEQILSGLYRIERIYPDRTRHIFVHDEDKGLIEETLRDQSQILTYLITGRGTTYGKVRKKERFENGAKKVFYQAFYDVNGRMIREVGDGQVTYHLHADGKMDPSAVGPDDQFRRYDGRGRLIEERMGGTHRMIAYLPNGDKKITTKQSSGKVDTQFISVDKR